MKCHCHTSEEHQSKENKIKSVNLKEVTNLSKLAQESVTKAAIKSANGSKSTKDALGEGIQTYIHVTPDGDTLVTSSFSKGNNGDIVLRGNIGPFPYEIHINVVLKEETIEVKLEMIKPFKVGPFTWHFNLGGIIRNKDKEIIGAATITLDKTDGIEPLGLRWWCVLKCGGVTIAPTLVLCLPSLAGGPAAYVACVVAKVGLGDAAKIAQCVAEKCT